MCTNLNQQPIVMSSDKSREKVVILEEMAISDALPLEAARCRWAHKAPADKFNNSATSADPYVKPTHKNSAK